VHFANLTTGLTEEYVLCIFMRPLKVGGEGLIFMNFHLHCLLIRFVLVFGKCLTLFLTRIIQIFIQDGTVIRFYKIINCFMAMWFT